MPGAKDRRPDPPLEDCDLWAVGFQNAGGETANVYDLEAQADERVRELKRLGVRGAKWKLTAKSNEP